MVNLVGADVYLGSIWIPEHLKSVPYL
eukprot:SAG11_NODE_35699_length_265_cov_0.927711_1_plen_26_part_01